MGRGKSEQRDARNQQYHGLRDNHEGAAVRVGQHGNNWQPLPVNEFARRNGLHINFAGFWTISDNGKKVEGTDPNSGFTFVMDSTRAYYRVQNEDGQYVDADGQTQSQGRYADANAFNAASHFKNSAS